MFLQSPFMFRAEQTMNNNISNNLLNPDTDKLSTQKLHGHLAKRRAPQT